MENFETVLNTAVLEKGLAYFENGAVSDLAERDKDTWSAIVTGARDYYVKIKFSSDVISQCTCDCPLEAEYCKHIVAVLHEIIMSSPEEADREEGIQKGMQSKKDFAAMIDSLSEKELRQFIIEYGRNNTDFKELLEAHFADQNGAVGKELYASLIKTAAGNSRGRGRFIDYYNAGNFVRDIDKLLIQANSALRMQHYAVVANISFAVIENVHEVLKDSDDSGGGIGGCVREGFEILKRLIAEDIPYELRERIFKDALKETKSSKYDFVGFDDNWLEVLLAAAYDQDKKTKALALIDKMLTSALKTKEEWGKDYDTQRLIKHKLLLLRTLNRKKDADKLRLQYLYLPDLRIELIEECIIEKKYNEAKKLIREGIEKAGKKDHPGTVHEFKKILMRIAFEEHDIDGLRYIATDLYERGRHPEYYKVIKDTYPKEEWPAIANTFIEELQTQNERAKGGRFNDDSRLAFIFIEEKDWHRLLMLIQGSISLHFIDQYSHFLTKQFPQEVLSAYKVALITYAEQNTGRNHYITIRERLKKMQEWEGGREVVKDLIAQFTGQYKARKAMVEELAKVRV